MAGADGSWSGKTAVVVGASRGIGLHAAKAFAERGAAVYAAVRSTNDELEKLDLNGGKVIVGVDLKDNGCVEKLKDGLKEASSIDVVLANAGMGDFRQSEGKVFSFDYQSARDMFEINSLGPIKALRACADKIADNTGKFFVMSSLMGSLGDNGSGGVPGYRMSKCAANQATVCCAHELKDRKIACIVIHPGGVETEMTSMLPTEKRSPEEAAGIIVDRMAELDFSQTGKFIHAISGREEPW